MQSLIGKAIELLRQGKKLPRKMFIELQEQGYDAIGLAQQYSPKKG